MRLVAIIDLVGEDVAGKTADILGAKPDGSPEHPGSGTRLRKLTKVEIKKTRSAKYGRQEWLYWHWTPETSDKSHDCGYSGVLIAQPDDDELDGAIEYNRNRHILIED